MKGMLVRVDKSGRVALPKAVREELTINAGDILQLSVHGDRVTLRPNRATGAFVKRGRALVFSTSVAGLLESETVETVRLQSYSNPSATPRVNKTSSYFV